MKLRDFFYKAVGFFKRKKSDKLEYQVKNADICFFDVPRLAFLVIRKYGWVVFFYKLFNYLRIIFKKLKDVMRRFPYFINRYTKMTIIVWRRDGTRILLKRIRHTIKEKRIVGRLKIPSKKGYDFDRTLFEDNLFKNWNQYRLQSRDFSYQPLISIIMPVYDVEIQWLKKAIESVLAQFYENWELCIVDDASTNKKTRPFLEEYLKKDFRIKAKFLDKNLHISGSSNVALSLATGEFVALLDNDDEITPDALFEVVRVLNKNSEIDIFYSDEDKIDEQGVFSEPAYKPNWDLDRMLHFMYTGHLGVYRKNIIDKIGGFRLGYEGSQDYDLMLRSVEQTNNIYHIEQILYHWRKIPNSVSVNPGAKSYAYEAGKKTLEDYLRRNNIAGRVVIPTRGLYEIIRD